MIEFSFKSPSGLAALVSTSSSTAQQAIYIKDMRSFAIPVPPLPEQQEIVRRVESLFALADQIEARLVAAKRQVDALTPSLLARAFAGKLVPQDPGDEPAAKLLERIRKSQPTNPRKGYAPKNG
jgi:type I restriction enzyme S subunit